MRLLNTSTPAPTGEKGAQTPVVPPPGPSAEEVHKLRQAVRSLQDEIKSWRESWQTDVEQRLDRFRDEIRREADASAKSMMRDLQDLSRRTPASGAEAPSKEELAADISSIYRREMGDLEKRVSRRSEGWEAKLEEQVRMIGGLAEQIARLEEQSRTEAAAEKRSPSEPVTPPAATGRGSEPEPPARPGLWARFWRYLNEPAIEIPVRRAKDRQADEDVAP